MSNLFIKETYINATERLMYGESGIYETWADETQLADLYRHLRSEYGSPQNQYTELKSGKSIKSGWVFHTTGRYDDTDKKYKREVWVSVYVKDEETGEFANAFRVLRKASEF